MVYLPTTCAACAAALFGVPVPSFGTGGQHSVHGISSLFLTLSNEAGLNPTQPDGQFSWTKSSHTYIILALAGVN